MTYPATLALGLFEAIRYVGTPIALVAFLVAVAAYVYRARLAERRQLIQAAPEAERARLLESTLRDFSTVPTETLTKEQRYQLALRLVEERAGKFRVTALVSVVLAVLLTAVVIVVTVAFQPEEAGAVSLVVRVHGPGGKSDFITDGEVTLDTGSGRDTRPLGPDGQVRFDALAPQALAGGLTLIPRVEGYAPVSPTTLAALPGDGVYYLELAPVATRVYGTVLDARRRPLPGVVLNFRSGLALDTTDQQGDFSVTVPLPPGARIPVRAVRDGAVGYNDTITIPEDEGVTLFFDAGPGP